jgi:hypothetical protein
MNYTYRQLLNALLELSEEELDMTATIHDVEPDAYYPITATDKTVEADVLDSDHPIIIINDPLNYQSRRETTEKATIALQAEQEMADEADKYNPEGEWF